MSAAAPPPALPPLYGAERWLATLSVSLATFMNVLDSSIANVSIPAIAGDMGVSPAQGTWVITSFGVANAIAVPLTGWLTQRFGQVRLFVASVPSTRALPSSGGKATGFTSAPCPGWRR